MPWARRSATLIWGVLLLGALGAVGLKWPKGLAYPLGVLLLWLAVRMAHSGRQTWPKRDRTVGCNRRKVASLGRTPHSAAPLAVVTSLLYWCFALPPESVLWQLTLPAGTRRRR